jgi:hypothetical protein
MPNGRRFRYLGSAIRDRFAGEVGPALYGGGQKDRRYDVFLLGQFCGDGKGLPHWSAVSEAPGMTIELGDTNKPISIAGNGAKESFFTELLSKPRVAQRS